mmetsp:Transcript_9593/g.31490  ORF Transcript_9593/g.31490 Transcript_9593/m.31490 type:complete len:204 (+) Transcript_9593:125-736(+)
MDQTQPLWQPREPESQLVGRPAHAAAGPCSRLSRFGVARGEPCFAPFARPPPWRRFQPFRKMLQSQPRQGRPRPKTHDAPPSLVGERRTFRIQAAESASGAALDPRAACAPPLRRSSQWRARCSPLLRRRRTGLRRAGAAPASSAQRRLANTACRRAGRLLQRQIQRSRGRCLGRRRRRSASRSSEKQSGNRHQRDLAPTMVY